jgi:hypothetical protein
MMMKVVALFVLGLWMSMMQLTDAQFEYKTIRNDTLIDGLEAARTLVKSLSDPVKMARVSEEITRICGVNVASLASLGTLVFQLLASRIQQIPIAIETFLIAAIRFIFALGNGAVTGILAFLYQLGVLLSTAIARLLAALAFKNNLLQQLLSILFRNRPLAVLLFIPLLIGLVLLGLKASLALGITLPIAIPLGLHGHDDTFEYDPPSVNYEYGDANPIIITGRPIHYSTTTPLPLVTSPYYYAASASYYNYSTTTPAPFYNQYQHQYHSRLAAGDQQHLNNAIDDWMPVIHRRKGPIIQQDDATNTNRPVTITKSIQLFKSLGPIAKRTLFH